MRRILLCRRRFQRRRYRRNAGRRRAEGLQFEFRHCALRRLGNAKGAIGHRGFEQVPSFVLVARGQLQQAEVHLSIADAFAFQLLPVLDFAMSLSCSYVIAPANTSASGPGHVLRSIFATFAVNSCWSGCPARTRARCNQITPSTSVGAKWTATEKSSTAGWVGIQLCSSAVPNAKAEIGSRRIARVESAIASPERHISMTMWIRRNADRALAVSHTIEIMFNVPADFPFGGISKISGIMMKETEEAPGTSPAGLTVTVTSESILIALSAAEGVVQGNTKLLEGRSWFDVPIVYNNGQRAIVAIETGIHG